ncbi:hypothetical protein V8G54_032662, partial [Vigna mungo]
SRASSSVRQSLPPLCEAPGPSSSPTYREPQRNPEKSQIKETFAPLLASTGHHECFLTQLSSSSSCYHELHNSQNHPSLKQSEQRFPSSRGRCRKVSPTNFGVRLHKTLLLVMWQ